MDLGLTGKVALVTGASRGIGRAIAEVLAAEGCDLVAAARGEEDLRSLADTVQSQTKRRVAIHTGDLRELANIEAAIAKAIATFGRLDILVNNAGATPRGDFFAFDDEDWHDGFELKLHGFVRFVRAAWPSLKASNGTVVNVIGIGGRNATADFTIGGAVNAALFNFTKAMAQVGVKDGIRVNAVSPGAVETDRLRGRLKLLSREWGVDEKEARKGLLEAMGLEHFGDPVEIGRLVAFLASDLSSYIRGAIVDIDGGITHAI